MRLLAKPYWDLYSYSWSIIVVLRKSVWNHWSEVSLSTVIIHAHTTVVWIHLGVLLQISKHLVGHLAHVVTSGIWSSTTHLHVRHHTWHRSKLASIHIVHQTILELHL